LLPIFSPEPVAVQAIPTEKSISPVAGNSSGASEKPNAIRVVKRVGTSFTPSIKDALAGKVVEKLNLDDFGKNIRENGGEHQNEPFTAEQLSQKWKEFLSLIQDRPSLVATLSNVPEIRQEGMLKLKIGNSVQEDEIRTIKPELVNFLRRELHNSEIEVQTVFERVEVEKVHYSDAEKMQILIQKNPDLITLTQKFNLGFNE
jgi:hypothetical protein